MMNNETKTMRDVFIERIYQRMHEDKNIYFLSADFGAPCLDRLRKKFKDRFINVGIAEQNLVNVSTGLALEGNTVYAYAIAPFLTMRAFEQIRNNLALHSQLRPVNINLLGVGAGLSYDVSGPTHHCLEDLSIMLTIPNIEVFSPSDWVLAERFFDYSLKVKKPKYLRFDSKPLAKIYTGLKKINIEHGFTELLSAKNICLVSTGYMTQKALRVAEKLREENVRVGVLDVFLLRPLNQELFFSALRKYDSIVTLEEAFIRKGGLDNLVSCILEQRNAKKKFLGIGFPDTYVFEVGNRDYLHRLYGLDEASLLKIIKEEL